MATTIRIYVEGTGEQPPEVHEFNLADFGGQLPGGGDLILDPRGDREETGVVWEVVGRYHDPGRAFDADACLRVQARARVATVGEMALFRS